MAGTPIDSTHSTHSEPLIEAHFDLLALSQSIYLFGSAQGPWWVGSLHINYLAVGLLLYLL